MGKSHIGPAVLLGAVLAGGLAIKAASGEFGWLTTFVGVTLLLGLFAWDEQPIRSFAQSLSYAAVCGFAFMLAPSWLFAYWEANRTYLAFPGGWYSIFWAIGFVVFVVVDRVRVGSSVPDSADYTPRVPAHVSAQSAARGSVFGIETPVSMPAAAASARTTSAPISEETTIAAYPMPAAPSYATAAAAPAPKMARPAPAPAVKETTIYVGLLGDSRGALRPVRAADLGHNFYQILEEVPPGDEWQFTTGQVVRCQKKNLSTGKGLVAVEEAPRA